MDKKADDKKAEYRLAIQRHFAEIDIIHQKIREVLKEAIDDYHFLDYQASTFWHDCEQSPTGTCVWDIRKDGYNIGVACAFCGEPVERK